MMMSCSNRIPKTNPDEFCQKYKECAHKSNAKEFDEALFMAECYAAASIDDVLRDTAAYDCADLDPCAYTVCVYIHQSAKSTAVRVTAQNNEM